MTQKPYDAGDESSVKKKKTKDELQKQTKKDDLIWVLSDPRGRRVVWRLLERCGIYKNSFTGNSHTFFNEGRRAVGLETLIEINDADPKAFSVMATEAANEKLENKNG